MAAGAGAGAAGRTAPGAGARAPHAHASFGAGGYGRGAGPGAPEGVGPASRGPSRSGRRAPCGRGDAMSLRSLRSQLTLALLVIMMICGLLVAVGTLVVLRAEQDFRELAEERIPRVALAGELAEVSGELADLSAAIVAWPAATVDEIEGPVAASTRKISSLLADPALSELPGRRNLTIAEEALHQALAAFRDTRRRLEQLDRHLQANDQELRWAHADVQDLTAALLQDLSFDMDARLSVLVESRNPGQRALAEQELLQDQQLRDRLQRLASEAATLAALLLHARNAVSEGGLDAVE